MDSLSKLAVHFAKKQFVSVKGPFKYYVSKEVGWWGGYKFEDITDQLNSRSSVEYFPCMCVLCSIANAESTKPVAESN